MKKPVSNILSGYSVILSPILFAIFPIIFFFATNYPEISLSLLPPLLLLAVCLGLFLFLLINIVNKNKYSSSLISSLFILVFFSYGHVSNLLNSFLFIQITDSIVIGPDKMLVPLVILVSILLIRKLRKTKSVKLNHHINLLLGLLCMFNILILLGKTYKPSQLSKSLKSSEQTNIVKSVDGVYPDVYYIILDGYARNDVLTKYYGFDNSEFIKFLRDTGFFVADKARANYPHTYLSLASSLNMKYVNYLSNEAPKNDPSIPYQMISNNQVAEIFKSYVYTTVNADTIWNPSGKEYNSDITINSGAVYKIFGKNIALTETVLVFVKTTAIYPFIKDNFAQNLQSITLGVFKKVPEIPLFEGNKFAFIHLNTPHPPYIFNADGSLVENPELDMLEVDFTSKEKYIIQLQYTNKLTIQMISDLLENSKNPPIIILQSDHGPSSLLGHPFKWKRPYNTDQITERVSILNAYYFPDKDYSSITDTSSPINTFPIIFNKYFGQDFELLPEKYYFTDYNNFYEFFELDEKNEYKK